MFVAGKAYMKNKSKAIHMSPKRKPVKKDVLAATAAKRVLGMRWTRTCMTDENVFILAEFFANSFASPSGWTWELFIAMRGKVKLSS